MFTWNRRARSATNTLPSNDKNESALIKMQWETFPNDIQGVILDMLFEDDTMSAKDNTNVRLVCRQFYRALKNKRQPALYIPLEFWFRKSPGLAIPFIGIQGFSSPSLTRRNRRGKRAGQRKRRAAEESLLLSRAALEQTASE